MNFVVQGEPTCQRSTSKYFTGAMLAPSAAQVSVSVCQWRGEPYDGTSTRTGPLQSKKIKIELKDNAKK